MFVINPEGDVYVQRSMLDKLQKYTGKKFELVIGVTDGKVNVFATDTFIVVKSPDGSHFLKRNIGLLYS